MTDEQFEELRAQTRQQIWAAYDLPRELTDAWEAIHEGDTDPACSNGEPSA